MLAPIEAENQRVVVTGGAGFIGSTLCRRLLSRGVEVVVYDSLAAGVRVQENASRLRELGALVVQGDIRDGDALHDVLRVGDGLVHLAAIASVPVSVSDPESCYSVNVRGAETVLAAAERAGVRRVVFASTAAVYGSQPRLPSSELDPVAPASPYASSKLAGEVAMAAAAVDTVSLRLFNVYGPGQDPQSSYSGVITRWVDGLLRDGAVQLFGDGSQTRDFVHVEDIAAALHAALEASDGVGGPLNIGSGQQTSLRTLLTVLAEVLAIEPQVRYGPVRAGDVPHSCADISRARQSLGFFPEVDLHRGLRSLIRVGV
ncbi:MAG: SDR family NAD(P)-dependent oxidoreductase [Actinomycetota bacterium]